MPRYPEERKVAVLSKLPPPTNRTVVSVSSEEGISEGTLYNWLELCRNRGMLVPGHRRTGDDWSPDAKLAVVIETAPVSEIELPTYCREKGLHVERVQKQHKHSQERIKQLLALHGSDQDNENS
ncbi:helix-turn-helix domain-containing protein [Marinimicrobium alkaliphilum]|uniref:hypothetical protein n=1 Tax=Marinimicrobium alkaliphilum TaxID=2202654 RepID=UPI000DB92AC8|nr:hypothetical protein [Marinimicrobium alkaliphilum]